MADFSAVSKQLWSFKQTPIWTSKVSLFIHLMIENSDSWLSRILSLVNIICINALCVAFKFCWIFWLFMPMSSVLQRWILVKILNILIIFKGTCNILPCPDQSPSWIQFLGNCLHRQRSQRESSAGQKEISSLQVWIRTSWNLLIPSSTGVHYSTLFIKKISCEVTNPNL